MSLGLRLALCLPALVLHAGAEVPSGKPVQDTEIEALARKGISSNDPALQKETLALLRKHRFRSVRAPHREFALFAQGVLEERLEGVAKAAVTLKKLERGWPQSTFLPEAQVILGQEAAERRKFPEAETRLRRALIAEVPAESKRRAQEWLLWTVVEQGQPEKGLSILESLVPIGTAKPSPQGLVAMTEILIHAKRKDQAEATLKDYRNLYPKGTLAPRVELSFARMLGTLGETKESAAAMQQIIRDAPNAPESDEARLALAALITDGKLNPTDGQPIPDADQLISDIHKTDKNDDLARRTLLLKLRRQVASAKWKEALDTVVTLRSKEPTSEESAQISTLRVGAFRAWSQELLENQQIDTLLPYLDAEGLQSLNADQRTALTRRLAQAGLPSAGLTIIGLAPASEQAALRKIIADTTPAGVYPAEALAVTPAKGESPQDALRRAQAALTLKDFKIARMSLGKAKAGPERIGVLTTFLRRPLEPSEGSDARRKDAEGWLARAPEKGPDREALVILVADLRAKIGDWKGALALYPTQATKPNLGWVALMRATCQLKLGQRDLAKATLQQAIDEPGFKMERESLYKQLSK